MYLFHSKKTTLSELKENPFKLEKEIQSLTEQNLEKVFGLKFISTEFALNEFRIDSLAYDEENKSFVIIEYKRGSSFSVVDQGYSYLALLLNNKADFVLEFNEKTGKSFNKKDINWEASRVIFVANWFTSHQRNAINFKDLPIELREVKRFETEIVVFNQLKAKNTSASVKTISKWDKDVSKIMSEVKTYTVDDHFNKWWDESREIYEKLSEKILALDSRIDEDPKKQYIGYKIGNKIVVEVKIYKSKVEIRLLRVKPIDLSDPDKKTKYFENSYQYFNKHISIYNITTEDDIDYWIFLAKQVLKKFFS